MPATYPQLATAAGTTISISTTAPAEHNETGFEGITTWVEIGQIVNSGGFPKAVRDFNDVNLLSGVVLVIPLNETMETELTDFLESASGKILSDDDKLDEALKRIVRQVAMEEIGKKPEVRVVISRLATE